MSLQIHNTLSPALAELARKISDRRPILEAIGAELVSITVRAFRDDALRPAPWALRKDGSVATLYKSGALKHSIRVISVTNGSVTVGSDRPYAAIQQLGGQTKPHDILAKYKAALAWPGAAHPVTRVHHPGSKIPARPFFPFRADGQLMPDTAAKIEAIIRAKIEAMLPKP